MWHSTDLHIENTCRDHFPNWTHVQSVLFVCTLHNLRNESSNWRNEVRTWSAIGPGPRSRKSIRPERFWCPATWTFSSGRVLAACGTPNSSLSLCSLFLSLHSTCFVLQLISSFSKSLEKPWHFIDHFSSTAHFYFPKYFNSFIPHSLISWCLGIQILGK